jgi:hypothetical protein
VIKHIFLVVVHSEEMSTELVSSCYKTAVFACACMVVMSS